MRSWRLTLRLEHRILLAVGIDDVLGWVTHRVTFKYAQAKSGDDEHRLFLKRCRMVRDESDGSALMAHEDARRSANKTPTDSRT